MRCCYRTGARPWGSSGSSRRPDVEVTCHSRACNTTLSSLFLFCVLDNQSIVWSSDQGGVVAYTLEYLRPIGWRAPDATVCITLKRREATRGRVAAIRYYYSYSRVVLLLCIYYILARVREYYILREYTTTRVCIPRAPNKYAYYSSRLLRARMHKNSYYPHY